MTSIRQRLIRVTAGLAAVGATLLPLQAPAGAATTPRAANLVPPTGTLFGASGSYRPQREADMGRKYDIAHFYDNWTTAFPTKTEQAALAAGTTPLISWVGTKTTGVTSGSQDGVINARADAVKALGQPIFLEWFWEMDSGHRLSMAVSQADFIAAWQHIHDVFVARGATNAVFVWCPTAWGFANGKAPSWYPGDGYVDWICTDGYNWAPTKPRATWDSFASIITPAYNFAVAHAKPFMVGETGAQERNAGEKAQWITDARNAIQTQFPQLKAFVYFDSKHTSLSNPNVYNDWRVDTSTSSYDAYKAMGNDPYFNPYGATPAHK